MSCTTRFVWPVTVVICVAILAVGCDSQQAATPATSPESEEDSGPPPPPVLGKAATPGKAAPGRAAPGKAAKVTPGRGVVADRSPSDDPVRRTQNRTQSANNLKRIGLALHNYHDRMRAFPAAHNMNPNGEPLLSWRVHILRLLGEEDLYAQFKLDEPWNSPHNQALIERMPAVYRSPNSAAEPGKTVYLGNASAKGIFVPPSQPQKEAPRGTGMRDIRDGTSNTLALVEANDTMAVIWTKPDDYVSSTADPARGLGFSPDQFLALFCDGSTVIVNKATSEAPELIKTLNALFSKDGGEVLGDFRVR